MDNKLVRGEVRIQEGQGMKRHCPEFPGVPVWLKDRRPGRKGVRLEGQELVVLEWDAWHGDSGGM